MKKIFFSFLILSLFSICMNHVEAIGGRGGGARGGGARGGGGRQFSGFSSPSMSRADFRQSPRQSDFNRNQLQQYARSPQRADNLRNDFPQLNQIGRQTSNDLSNRFQNQHSNVGDWFNNDFAARNRLDNFADGNLWRGEGWAATAAWMGLGAYDAGYPAYYYDPSGVYTEIPPQDAYAYSPATQNVIVVPQQASSSTNATTTSSTSEWLPLGVYAMGSSADDALHSNMVMQLSINKSGYLSGTYYNTATNKSYPMEGMVNKKSQEAIWKMSDNADSPVASTGIFNLTQDVANINLHFPSSNTDQTKVLVKLKK